MTQFDVLLRRALMDANLAQYQRPLQSMEAKEPDFSPGYLRERMRVLSNPQDWERQRSGRRKLDWRLIVLIAVLLLLSACAYAVATGQFSQWFPFLGINLQSPETSEEVLHRTGTMVQQSQTKDGATVTLNAAVWDGKSVWLSFAAECPDLPAELNEDSHIYYEECSLELPMDQRKDYLRKDALKVFEKTPTPEELEEQVQFYLERKPPYFRPIFSLSSREDNTLTYDVSMSLAAYIEQPELTLHLENIAIYEDSDEPVTWQDGIRTGPEPEVPILQGPFDFTFAFEKPILPIQYKGDIRISLEDIPLRFTGFQISAFDMDVDFEVLAPVEFIGLGEYDEQKQLNPDKLYYQDVDKALSGIIRGLWTKDGSYVDLSFSQRANTCGITSSSEGVCGGSMSVSYPYPVSPATVTAVDLNGIRVELSELEQMTG